MAKEKIRVFVVDDNKTFLKGISFLLDNEERYEIIGQYPSGRDLMDSPRLQEAQIVLLDIEMPYMDGIETAKRLNFILPDVKMIAITMYREKVYLQELIESGFMAFINKTEVSEKLVATMDEVMQGNFQFPEDIKV